MKSRISSGKALIALFLVMTLQFACVLPAPVESSGKAISENWKPSTTSNSSEAIKYYEVSGTVNVRECASTTCDVIGYLYPGRGVVEGFCGSGKWCRINYKGNNAWVFAPCLGQEGICK